MKQPKLLLLLAILVILVFVVAAAEAKSQLASPQTTQNSGQVSPIAQNLEVVKHWAGRVEELVIHGFYAYIGNGSELQVFSLADPAAPVLVASLMVDKPIRYLYASGNYLYIDHRPVAQLTIVNISDPAEPVWLSSLNLPYLPYEIYWYDTAVSADHVLLATSQGLLIVDMSDPTDPHLTSSYPGEIRHVVAIDSYVYLISHRTLFVLDISNPAAPITLYEQEVDGHGLELIGNYLYAFGDPTLILDITNPAAPQEAGTTEYTAYGARIVDGDYLYLWTSIYVTILDITNPLEPIWLSVSEITTQGANSFQVSNGYIYLLRTYYGPSWFTIYDATMPTNVIEVNNYLLDSGAPSGQLAVDEYLYLKQYSTLGVFDISDPVSPSLITSYEQYVSGGGNSHDVAVQDDFAYLINWQCGGRDCWTVLEVVDVSNPVTPTLAGITDMIFPLLYANWIKISGHYAFLTQYGYSGGNRIAVYDIADPTEPTLVQLLPDWWPIAITDLAAAGDYLYVTTYSQSEGKMEIVDFSNPAAPTIIDSYQTPQHLYSVNIVDSYLYLVEGSYPETLHVLDISDPAAPIEVNTYHLPQYLPAGLGGQPLIEGNYAYIGNNVFDISNPANPIPVAFYPLSGEWGVHGEYIYIVDDDNGWTVLKQTPVMTSLTPGVTSSLTYTYYQHFPTHFTFPADSITQPITITVNPSTAEDTANYSFARHTFGLSALQGDTQLPSYTFNTPITITLRYSHDDVSVISNEAELALWVWTDEGWQDATTTCDSPTPYVRDIINNVLTLTICQTGRFVLFGPTHQRYLPFIDRH